MFVYNLLFTLLTVFAHALPTQKLPIAYNLHQELSPRDVNSLTKEQKIQAALDVQATIDEVQKLLALDPSLPRLTKGEIKDLFEKVTKDELEQSVLNGDQKKQNQMRYLLQAIPYHEEIEVLEDLARKAATTMSPKIEPEIPSELKNLFENYGLLDAEGKPVEISQLPETPNVDHPSTILAYAQNNHKELSLKEIQKAALVNSKDYENFKPFGDKKQNVTSEMEAFLKQFGLVDKAEPKKKKSTKSTKIPSNSAVPSIDSSYLIPGYSSLLDNIGITTIKDKNAKKSKPSTSTDPRPDYKRAGDDDFHKLEQLLDTIRVLEKLNASLTEKEINRLNLNNFNLSDSLLSNGPDPLNYHSQFSDLKNEVKRQNPTEEPTRLSLPLTGPLLESSLESTDANADANADEKAETKVTTTSTTSTTTEASTTATVTTTEEARKNSLEDEIEPIDEPEQLPPPRRSGFYMLFDWNSFLEVGEDPDKIVVRFEPKIGDPSRFLPVNIP